MVLAGVFVVHFADCKLNVETQNEKSDSSASLGARGDVDKNGKASGPNDHSKSPVSLESHDKDDQSVRSLSSIDTGYTPESLLDTPLARAHDIVTLLMQLGPSLLDPTPHNRSELSAHSGAAQQDISHVHACFPKADDSLAERLGRANWERRQFLRNLRDAREDNRPRADGKDLDEAIQHTLGSNPSTSAVATAAEESDAGNSEAGSSLGTIDTDLSDKDDSYSDISLSEGRQKTARTYAPSDFQFSLDETHSTAITEPSKGVVLQNQSPEEDVKRYRVPRPPGPNENLTGAPFLCQFCSHMVLDITTASQWK